MLPLSFTPFRRAPTPLELNLGVFELLHQLTQRSHLLGDAGQSFSGMFYSR